VWVTSSLATVLTPTAAALGNFDGVHGGHRQVIQPILKPFGSEPKDAHVRSTVLTFNPHPKEFFTGQSRRLLTPLHEKVAELSRLGVEQLVLLPFDRELASLSPEQFVHDILVQKLQVKRVSVGQDFCFGRQRAGTAGDLQAIASHYGIEVAIVSLHQLEGERISSSAIRQALQEGELQLANQLLGRPYSLVGTVAQGQQLGRTLGFPTANLDLPGDKFLPRQGVYAVRVRLVEGEAIAIPPTATLPGVMNLGCRPTVEGTGERAEVHLLDWSGDLYGCTLQVELETFLRTEQKFTSLEDLKAQIQLDCTLAREFFARDRGLNNPRRLG
jgi:riboflavin kinase/FMN adenylyltransferase